MSLLHDVEKKKLDDIAKSISLKDNSEEIDNNIYDEFKNREDSFRIGDTVKIHYKIVEGKRERIQIFEGYVIAIKGKGLSKTFKVRKISYGVGVERTFPVYSPKIAKIELVRRGRIKRAKLYYLRERSGKSAIIKEKINYKK